MSECREANTGVGNGCSFLRNRQHYLLPFLLSGRDVLLLRSHCRNQLYEVDILECTKHYFMVGYLWMIRQKDTYAFCGKEAVSLIRNSLKVSYSVSFMWEKLLIMSFFISMWATRRSVFFWGEAQNEETGATLWPSEKPKIFSNIYRQHSVLRQQEVQYSRQTTWWRERKGNRENARRNRKQKRKKEWLNTSQNALGFLQCSVWICCFSTLYRKNPDHTMVTRWHGIRCTLLAQHIGQVVGSLTGYVDHRLAVTPGKAPSSSSRHYWGIQANPVKK